MLLYDRQREYDLLKLGLLDSKAEAEGIGRLMAQMGAARLNIPSKRILNEAGTYQMNEFGKKICA